MQIFDEFLLYMHVNVDEFQLKQRDFVLDFRLSRTVKSVNCRLVVLFDVKLDNGHFCATNLTITAHI